MCVQIVEVVLISTIVLAMQDTLEINVNSLNVMERILRIQPFVRVMEVVISLTTALVIMDIQEINVNSLLVF
jgi:hypothetical protein